MLKNLIGADWDFAIFNMGDIGICLKTKFGKFTTIFRKDLTKQKDLYRIV